ncbi:hypothetical protein EMIT051CA3_90118 [Pseudomonas chlororaphis]
MTGLRQGKAWMSANWGAGRIKAGGCHLGVIDGMARSPQTVFSSRQAAACRSMNLPGILHER